MAEIANRRMIRFIWLLVVMTLATVMMPGCAEQAPAPAQQHTADEAMPRTTITVAGVPIEVELALNNEDRHRGMGGRESLAENAGMLFVFPNATYRNFWMKDCLIDLDIIYITSSGKVSSIHTLPAPPPGTPDRELPAAQSVGPAQFVLELNAGRAAALGLDEGDIIDMPMAQLKRRAK